MEIEQHSGAENDTEAKSRGSDENLIRNFSVVWRFNAVNCEESEEDEENERSKLFSN